MPRNRPGTRSRINRGLRIALRGRRDPAPAAGQRTYIADSVSDVHTRKVLDLTARLAEVMLSSGSGTADVVATAQDVAAAYQLTDCVVDITSMTIIVSALPTADSPPVTIMRAVRARAIDYTRLSELDKLIQHVTSGGFDVDEAHEAMDVLTERPHPYPRWLATAAWVGFALGIAMLLGGDWLTCLLAAVTAGAIDRVGRVLNRMGTPFFFQHAVGAAIATLVAVAAYRFAGQGPSALVATGIVLLLSGLTIVGAVQDALTGYMVTALARLGEAMFLTAGIVVGIVGALQLTAFLGIQIELHVIAAGTFIPHLRPLPIFLAIAGAALAGACLAIASYARPRSVVTGGVAAGLGETMLIALGAAGFGQWVATGLSAVGVGFVATLISIWRKSPALVTATSGIMPMLPGLAVFWSVFAIAVENNFGDGLAHLLSAAATALALGSGVVLGELLGSPLRYRAGRIDSILKAEGPPGLRRAVGRVVQLRPIRGWTAVDGHRSRSVALRASREDDSAEYADRDSHDGEP